METMFYSIVAGFVGVEILFLLMYEYYNLNEKTHPREYMSSYTILTVYSLGIMLLTKGFYTYIVLAATIILTGFLVKTYLHLRKKQQEELNTEDTDT